ncbi:MAG: SH3 beta-barrel fold-containing protein [Ghiorsea sp.]
MTKTIEEVKQLLNNNVARIVFTKADGTLRDMRATTQTTFIHDAGLDSVSTVSPTLATEAGGVAKNDSLVKVVDLDIGEWRCFNYDRLMSLDLE